MWLISKKVGSLIETTIVASHYIQVEQLKNIESNDKVYAESSRHKERRLARRFKTVG